MDRFGLRCRPEQFRRGIRQPTELRLKQSDGFLDWRRVKNGRERAEKADGLRPGEFQLVKVCLKLFLLTEPFAPDGVIDAL
jgi:hypothetical protein